MSSSDVDLEVGQKQEALEGFNKILARVINTDDNEPISPEDYQIFLEGMKLLTSDDKQVLLREYFESGEEHQLELYDARALLMAYLAKLTHEDIPVLEQSLYLMEDNKIKKGRVRGKNGKSCLNFYEQVGGMAHTLVEQINSKTLDISDNGRPLVINENFVNHAKILDKVTVVQNKYMGDATTDSAYSNAIDNREDAIKLASNAFIAKEIIYKNLANGSLIPLFDDEGKKRLYQVHELANDMGLVCYAFTPWEAPKNKMIDIKIAFRGSQCPDSFIMDLEAGGAGKRVMDSNCLQLLESVNNLIVGLKQQEKYKDAEISMTTVGHSLGGSLANRFFSEFLQAYYDYNHNDNISEEEIENLLKQANMFSDSNVSDDDYRRAAVATNENFLMNREKMGQKFSGIGSVSKVSVVGLNVSMLDESLAEIGDCFAILTTHEQDNFDHDKLLSVNISEVKVEGDVVSLTGDHLIGRHLLTNTNERISVEVLKKTSLEYRQSIPDRVVQEYNKRKSEEHGGSSSSESPQNLQRDQIIADCIEALLAIETQKAENQGRFQATIKIKATNEMGDEILDKQNVFDDILLALKSLKPAASSLFNPHTDPTLGHDPAANFLHFKKGRDIQPEEIASASKKLSSKEKYLDIISRGQGATNPIATVVSRGRRGSMQGYQRDIRIISPEKVCTRGMPWTLKKGDRLSDLSPFIVPPINRDKGKAGLDHDAVSELKQEPMSAQELEFKAEQIKDIMLKTMSRQDLHRLLDSATSIRDSSFGAEYGAGSSSRISDGESSRSDANVESALGSQSEEEDDDALNQTPPKLQESAEREQEHSNPHGPLKRQAGMGQLPKNPLTPQRGLLKREKGNRNLLNQTKTIEPPSVKTTKKPTGIG